MNRKENMNKSKPETAYFELSQPLKVKQIEISNRIFTAIDYFLCEYIDMVGNTSYIAESKDSNVYHRIFNPIRVEYTYEL